MNPTLALAAVVNLLAYSAPSGSWLNLAAAGLCVTVLLSLSLLGERS